MRIAHAIWVTIGLWCAGASAQVPSTRTITPAAIAVDAQAKEAYAVDEAGGQVVLLNLSTGARAFWKVGKAPDALVLDATTRRLYVVDTDSGSVSVVDTTTGEIVAEPKTDHRPYTAAIDTVRHRLWISNTFSNELTEIDEGTGNVKRLPLGSKDAVVVDELRGRVFLGSYEDPTVLVLDEQTGATKRLAAQVHLWAMAVDPETGLLWAAVIGANTLLGIDPETGAVRAVKTEAMPDAVAIMDGRAYVAEREANAVEVVDLSEGTVQRRVHTGARPEAVAVGHGTVWVANTVEQTVTVWNTECPAKIATLPVEGAPYAVVTAGDGTAVVALLGARVVDTISAPLAVQTCSSQ